MATADLHSRITYYHDQLDKELSKYPVLKELEDKTKVPKTTLVLGVVSLFFFLVFFNVGGQLITDLIAWVYPAYASFKAIESPGTDDDVQWLTYWTVFGFVNILEFFIDILLYWFPFWFLFKTIFVLWLSMPQFNGAVIIYKGFLRGFLKTYEKGIDSAGSKLKAKVAGAHEPEGSSSKRE